MYSLADILFLMGLGFSLAAPLGPVNMEMIKQSLRSKFGFILGTLTGIGAMTGDFIIATSVLYVGEQYLKGIIEHTVVYTILLIMNIFILSYIGLSALKAPAPEIQSDTIKDKEEIGNERGSILSEIEYKGVLQTYGTGFVIVITSPWSYFWWTSFGGYIINSGLPLATGIERLTVTAFFLAGIFAWVVLFTGLLGISRKFASAKTLNYITKGSALIILGFAVKILYDGLIFLGVF